MSNVSGAVALAQLEVIKAKEGQIEARNELIAAQEDVIEQLRSENKLLRSAIETHRANCKTSCDEPFYGFDADLWAVLEQRFGIYN